MTHSFCNIFNIKGIYIEIIMIEIKCMWIVDNEYEVRHD